MITTEQTQALLGVMDGLVFVGTVQPTEDGLPSPHSAEPAELPTGEPLAVGTMYLFHRSRCGNTPGWEELTRRIAALREHAIVVTAAPGSEFDLVRNYYDIAEYQISFTVGLELEGVVMNITDYAILGNENLLERYEPVDVVLMVTRPEDTGRRLPAEMLAGGLFYF
jgi:hypothetical protein